VACSALVVFNKSRKIDHFVHDYLFSLSTGLVEIYCFVTVVEDGW